MGKREVIIKQSVANSIAKLSLYIESKGLLATAEKFSDSVYDYFLKLSDVKRGFAVCRDPERSLMGYKCVVFKKKYTVVFIESENAITICEFIPSKLIRW